MTRKLIPLAGREVASCQAFDFRDTSGSACVRVGLQHLRATLQPGVGPAVPLAPSQVGDGCRHGANAWGEVVVFHAG